MVNHFLHCASIMLKSCGNSAYRVPHTIADGIKGGDKK